MKKVCLMLVIALLCFSAPVKVSASQFQSSAVQPYYVVGNNTTSLLYINGTTATVESIAIRGTSIKKIKAEQTLQKQGLFLTWSQYGNTIWTKTVYSNTLNMSNTKTGLEDGTYRLKTVFTLTNSNGETEKITVYSETVEVG